MAQCVAVHLDSLLCRYCDLPRLWRSADLLELFVSASLDLRRDVLRVNLNAFLVFGCFNILVSCWPERTKAPVDFESDRGPKLANRELGV